MFAFEYLIIATAKSKRLYMYRKVKDKHALSYWTRFLKLWNTLTSSQSPYTNANTWLDERKRPYPKTVNLRLWHYYSKQLNFHFYTTEKTRRGCLKSSLKLGSLPMRKKVKLVVFVPALFSASSLSCRLVILEL